jgi:uncharacterized membrane protein
MLLSIDPPAGAVGTENSAAAAAAGWWVVPQGEDSLWEAAGSVMISLPQQQDEIEAVDDAVQRITVSFQEGQQDSEA